MSKPDITIDETDTAALFIATTGDGRVRFSITDNNRKVLAFVDLTPERAEDIAKMSLEAVGRIRGVWPPVAGGGGRGTRIINLGGGGGGQDT